MLQDTKRKGESKTKEATYHIMEAELSDATAVAHRPNQPVAAMSWKLSKWVGGTGERGYESRILELG
jgi:hypothetical protein